MNCTVDFRISLRLLVVLFSFTIALAKAQDKTPTLDIQALAVQAAAQGKHRVDIPAGTYRVSEPISLKNLKDMEIWATGVLLIKTKVGEALTVSRCKNLKIIGLKFDYDPIPFTQGTIVAVSSDGLQVDFEIHAGYPPLTADMLGTSARHYFDAETRLWKEGINHFTRPKIELLGEKKGRALFDRPQTGVKPGDYLTFDRRKLDKSPCISIRNCPGKVEFEDVTIYAAGGLAIVGRYCEDQVVFRRVKIERGPRPIGATEDRLLSTDADAINFAYCRKGPLLENCDFSFMGDDSLNMHGIALVVLRVVSPTCVLVSRGDGPEDFAKHVRTGDRIDILMPKTFEKLGQAACESFKTMTDSGNIRSEEVAAYFEDFKNSKVPPTVFQINFKEPVSYIKTGQWLEFPELNCPGFIVRNSTFHDHRARGLRIMASHGLVEGNRFERIGSAAIQIGPEWQYWREAGWVKDVQVRNNKFKDIGIGGDFTSARCYTPGVISIVSRTDAQSPPYPREQEDIVIEGNEIDGSPASAIHAYGVNRLVISNNIIKRVNTGDVMRTGRDFQLSARHAIELEGVSNPVVNANQLSK